MEISKKESLHLRYLDAFGLAPSLNFRNQTHIHSIFGFYMTLILIGFAGYSLFFFGENMFKKTNPTIVQSEQPGKLWNQYLAVNQHQLMIGIRNTTSGKYISDNSIYTVSVTSNPLLGVDAVAEPCLPQNISERFNIHEQIWCFRSLNSNFLPIKDFNAINMFVTKCKNTTDQVCRPQEEIDAIMKLAEIDVMWNDVSLDFNDFENPIETFLNRFTFTLVEKSCPRLDIIFRLIEVQTDSGLINEDLTTKSVIGVDYPFYTIVDPSLNGDAIFRVSLDSAGRLTAVTRRYQKIQDLIAQVVSVLNIIYLVFQLLAQRYTDTRMYAEVSNECMDIITTKKTKNSYIHENSKSEMPQSPTTKILEPESLKDFEKDSGYQIKRNKTIEKKNGDIQASRNRFKDLNDDPEAPSSKSSQKNSENHELNAKIPSKQILSSDKLPQVDLDISVHIEENEYVKSDEETSKAQNEKSKFHHIHEDIIIPQVKVLNKENLSFCFSDWLKAFFRKDETFTKINKLKDQIDLGFDVTNLFLKLHEIERLKDILLTDEQRYLFNKMKRPQVRFRRVGKELDLELIHNDGCQFHSCEDALRAILSKSKLGKIDKNIIKMANMVLDV